ncbi:MAG: hypothetical protein MJK04_02395 [Psychrosphaera sp.]|nr:hypothetical protein [Psychrosphaera sp.]
MLPSHAMAWLWLGSVYHGQLEYGLTEQAYQQALDIDPLILVILASLADLKLGMGQRTEAFKYYDKVFKIDPNATPFYRSSARTAVFEGLYQQALKWAKKAVELAPTDPLNHNMLAFVYVYLGQFERAEALLLQGKGDSENNIRSRSIWYHYYWFSGQWDKMQRFSDDIVAQIEASSSFSEKQFVLNVYKSRSAKAHVLSKNYRQAIEVLVPVLAKIDPDNVLYRLDNFPYLAFAYRQSGQQANYEAVV